MDSQYKVIFGQDCLRQYENVFSCKRELEEIFFENSPSEIIEFRIQHMNGLLRLPRYRSAAGLCTQPGRGSVPWQSQQSIHVLDSKFDNFAWRIFEKNFLKFSLTAEYILVLPKAVLSENDFVLRIHDVQIYIGNP